MSYVGSLFQHFAGRNRPRPHSPEPSVENRNFTPSPGIRITPTSGPTSGPFVAATTPFAPPEPSLSPTPTNMFDAPIPGARLDQQRTVAPTATTGKPLLVYPMSAPPMRITPVNVRRSGGES